MGSGSGIIHTSTTHYLVSLNMQKHLNIEKNETAKILVDYSENKFYAYVQKTNGCAIVFIANHDWKAVKNNPEFCKYANEWKIPVECSREALRQRMKAL